MNVSVNLEMVESLKNMYQASEAIILEMMPEVNWNSTQQVKKYFNDTYWMNLPDTKIETLKALRDLEEHTSDCFNDLTGLIELYKTKYILKNYLNCLLTHGSTGYVTLLEERVVTYCPITSHYPKQTKSPSVSANRKKENSHGSMRISRQWQREQYGRLHQSR